MSRSYDHIIVGGGILGASFASALLAQGKRVALFERFSRPNGGSVRNFGLAWPFLVSTLDDLPLGLRTSKIYRELAAHFDFGLNHCGALLVADTEAQAAVLTDFQKQSASYDLSRTWLDPRQALERHPLLRQESMKGGLFFPDAAAVDPRVLVHRWLGWMKEQRGLDYFPATTVVRIEEAAHGCSLQTSAGETWRAGEVLICGGEEFQTLFPDTFRESGIRRCKLAMMQTEPLEPIRGVPGLAFGRSLRHYPLFSSSPSFADLLKEPTDADCDRLGIHLLVKPCLDGSLVIGDSHEYTAADEPHDFDYPSEVERLLFKLAGQHLNAGPLPISKRWLGYYAKHPEKPWIEEHPMPHVTILSGLTIGMSAGPAFAERRVAVGWN